MREYDLNEAKAAVLSGAAPFTGWVRVEDARAALLRSPASEAPAAPDAQEVRKLVRKAFCAGYLANGPTNPFEMEEKADRYIAIVCDPPRLDRIVRPSENEESR